MPRTSRVAWVLVLALAQASLVEVSGAACPGEKEAAFLKSLNEEGEFGLASVQGDLFLRQAAREAGCETTPELLLEAGRAWYHLGDFRRVRAAFREAAIADGVFRRYWVEAHFLALDRPDLLDTALAFVEAFDGRSTLMPGERALYRSSARYLRGDLPAARAAWPADSPGTTREEPRRYLDLGYKSPALAAALSLAPGGGYLYAGQSGDAATALLVTGVCYGAAAWYFHHRAEGRGWMAAGLGGVFHLSGIYGGQRAARETNRSRRIGFLQALHPHLP